MRNDHALILLSTYNGEKYLSQQIESIRQQSFPHWNLLIRDDSSQDSTKKIIQEYVAKDARIHYLEDTAGNIYIPQSYSHLMTAALHRQENYIFFSDQDDIWLPNKIASSIAALKKMEAIYNDSPLLIHTDLQIVDENLKRLHPSFLQAEGLKRNTINPIKTLLINNFITGCTIAFNRNLLQIVTPIPQSIFMHDWWCAVCAASLGKISFIHEPTILYRQHGNNSIGSKNFWQKFSASFTKNSLSKRKKNLAKCFNQARALLSRIEDLRMQNSISEHQFTESISLLKKFSALPNAAFLKRLHILRELKLQPASRLRKILFYSIVLSSEKRDPSLRSG